MKTAILALALGLGLASQAVAESDYVFDAADCSNRLQRPIAVPTSTGQVVYLQVNTLTSACATNWHNDPLFISTAGGDSGGSSGGDAGGGCGGGDGGNGGAE